MFKPSSFVRCLALGAALVPLSSTAQECKATNAAYEISQDEANQLYNCLAERLAALPENVTGIPGVPDYRDWEVVSTAPLPSATHGSMLVNHIVSPEAAALYKQWEQMSGKKFPPGAILAKESLMIDSDGNTSPGPLFLMEKTAAGTAPDTDDWIYSRIFTDGRIQRTLGPGSANLDFCHDCHAATIDQFDAMFFPPERYRIETSQD
ncbi:MAG: cytochrome P460 family protein [Paracoccaceae bacterium]|nr:cytochrome P460 family protein [Paracoccaceae bacterium]